MTEAMIKRIDRQVEQFLNYAEKVKRQVRKGVIGGEEDRLWLEQFAKGDGLDICCGDFRIGDAVGIDGDKRKIGADYQAISADELTPFRGDELDFIVTNYIEAFPNVLKALHDWHRVLRTGGVLAFVCANADKYDNTEGPLSNPRRLSIFTPVTVRFYLERASFTNVSIELTGKHMRVKANKA